MVKKSYSELELKVIAEKPGFFGGPGTPIYNTPISYRENMNALYWHKDPTWVHSFMETDGIRSTLYNDNFGRAGAHNDGLIDVFGAQWKFVPSAGGSITVAGQPVFEDANDWKEKVKMPDVESWDWENDLKDVDSNPRFAQIFTFVNGFWFERLISLMDFDNAAMALIDEEQQDAVYEFFEATTEVAIKLVDLICKYAPSIDGFNIHDDWGAQRSPFFSEEVARKLFLPHMKKLVGHIHSKGRFCTLHSCGCVQDRVEIFIEAGFDGWQPQTMNDLEKLYELYGDKIVFDVMPEEFDPENEEAAVQAARNFVDKYCHKGKVAGIGTGGRPALNCKAFAEELYRYSREKFLSFE